MILILGVFLGFQVTDWANERANRSAEVRHLEEIAEVIGVAPITVSREWAKARAWLHREIAGEPRHHAVRG